MLWVLRERACDRACGTSSHFALQIPLIVAISTKTILKPKSKFLGDQSTATGDRPANVSTKSGSGRNCANLFRFLLCRVVFNGQDPPYSQAVRGIGPHRFRGLHAEASHRSEQLSGSWLCVRASKVFKRLASSLQAKDLQAAFL